MLFESQGLDSGRLSVFPIGLLLLFARHFFFYYWMGLCTKPGWAHTLFCKCGNNNTEKNNAGRVLVTVVGV